VKRAPLLFVLLASFGDERITEGLEEPFAVQDAQFIEGELPGLPPDRETVAPRPTAATTELTYLRPGLADVEFFGWATLDAVAVAARLEGQGTGYWVVPTGPPDPTVQGEPVRVWRFNADLHDALPPGRHRILVAATNAAGGAGNQVATSLCVNRPVPDNGNACDPRKAPPELAITLTWDRPVDLDLAVVTPDGTIVAARTPTKGLGADQKIVRNAAEATPPGVGYLDADSNADCHVDGRQRETVVFQNQPAPGTYLVYANLHSPCGQSSVRYTVSRHTRAALDPAAGTFTVAESDTRSGTLLAVQANGGTRLGTFVAELPVP